MDQKSAKKTSGIVFREVIGQRYAQEVRQALKDMKFDFSESAAQSQTQESRIFEIHLPDQISSKQSKFYFGLLKNFYELRKILNPELTFEAFLKLYVHQINEKIEKYQLQTLIESEVQSHNLSSFINSKELSLMKSETVKLVNQKKEEIQVLEAQSKKVNRECQQLVKDLIEKNTHLNVENIQYQLKLKEHEIEKKQKATQIYLPSSSLSNKAQTRVAQFQDSIVSSINEEKKQQVQRIKVVVNNNMWGWGDKIHERLSKLKQLQIETNQNSSLNP